jgi:hypothetical protein
MLLQNTIMSVLFQANTVMYSTFIKICLNWLELQLTGTSGHYVLERMQDNYAIKCGNKYWEANDTWISFAVKSLHLGGVYSTTILTSQLDM